ncbi:TonB-dependent receptor [Parabacteroides sp. OttesenSCG-928-K15]|nr:TonB-dependent receptor [Parabacteroides sp. OttesenSCG-928-K15]
MKIRAIIALLFIYVCMLIPSVAYGQGKVNISGVVYDADGNPLDLVLVQVKNTPLVGAMTNEKGQYSVPVSPGDSITLLFTCLGYHKAERILPQVTADLKLNVRMLPKAFELGEAVVTATRRQTTAMETLDAEKVRFLPDPSGGSIESLVVTFAGVSSSNELSSQYSVRGGSFDENMVYVNGLEVFRPLLIRSGQQEGLSFVNPDLTESVNFAAGGFEARYGDKMSSVLDVAYKRPEELEGSASASFLGANAYVGGSHGKVTHVTGLRYKTGRSLLRTLDTDAEFDPNFVDLQTFITYQPAKKWEIDFMGNLAVNNYKFIPRVQRTSFGTAFNPQNFEVYFDGQERDKFQTLFGALSLKYKPNENTTLALQSSLFNSRESESYDISGEYWMSENGSVSPNEEVNSNMTIGRYHEHARNRLQADVFNVVHSGSTRLEKHTLQWGLTLQSERIQDRISEWEKRDSAGYSLPHTEDAVSVINNLYSDHKINSMRYSGYLQDAFRFRTSKGLFTLVGGVRGSYWDYNKEFIVSPRVSLGFVPNTNQNFTFRVASGIYYQSPFYKEIRKIVKDADGNEVVELNENIKSQRSIHFILGSDYSFKAMDRNFKFTAEMYYKKLDNVIPYTLDNVKLRYYGENCAKGYTMGLDMKFFGEFVPGTDSWISVSLMKTEQTIREKTEAPMPNDHRYNVSLFFQDYFPGNDRIKLNLKGVIAGGLPITIPHKGYEAGYFRLPTYRRIDIGLSYQLAGGLDPIMDRGVFRHLKNIWVGVDVFNLLDFRNTNSYYWITDVYNQQYAVPNHLTGRQLNLRLIVDF